MYSALHFWLLMFIVSTTTSVGQQYNEMTKAQIYFHIFFCQAKDIRSAPKVISLCKLLYIYDNDDDDDDEDDDDDGDDDDDDNDDDDDDDDDDDGGGNDDSGDDGDDDGDVDDDLFNLQRPIVYP